MRYDPDTGEWVTLGGVRKTGTDAWKRASFRSASRLISPRNHLEDVHRDLMIAAGDDGPEWVRAMELDFVPAREWAMEVITRNEPVDGHTTVPDFLAVEVDVPAGAVAALVEIPVWTGSLDASLATVTVSRRAHDGSWQRLGQQETYMPADGDWIGVPVAHHPGAGRHRIELTRGYGSIGWRLGADGKPAYRVSAYRTTKSSSSAVRVAGTKRRVRVSCARSLRCPPDVCRGCGQQRRNGASVEGNVWRQLGTSR